MLRWRFVGDLVARLDTARLARTLGTLVRSGVPLLNALNLSRPVLSNRVLADALEAAGEEVKTGSGLGYALGRRKVFPRLAVQMIQVGEESGELDTMLERAATNQERELDSMMGALVGLLGPLLIVVMGLFVMGIVFAMLMPIFEMNNYIR